MGPSARRVAQARPDPCRATARSTVQGLGGGFAEGLGEPGADYSYTQDADFAWGSSYDLPQEFSSSGQQ